MKSNLPFESLGKELRKLRNKRNESLIEVSGAVEIESDELNKYEIGSIRPSEDILALLISYFKVKETDSNKLWKLAGYENENKDGFILNEEVGFQTQPVLLLPVDARIVYTDLVHVMVNNYGVVINFMQGGGANSQPLAVSRIGMSKEHAYSLLEVLKDTLEESSKPKQITKKTKTIKKITNKDKKEKKS